MRFATEDPDDPESLDLEDFPTLQAVARFAQAVPHVPWFLHLGEPLTEEVRRIAESYVHALGFPDCAIAVISDWEEAGDAAESPGFDDASWEVEEQLTAGLVDDALAIVEEQELAAALTHASAAGGDAAKLAIEEAAALAGHSDPALLDAAAGAVTKACYQAALLLAGGGDEDHAVVFKYKLFESGRWPVGIIGSTFNIF